MLSALSDNPALVPISEQVESKIIQYGRRGQINRTTKKVSDFAGLMFLVEYQPILSMRDV